MPFLKRILYQFIIDHIGRRVNRPRVFLRAVRVVLRPSQRHKKTPLPPCASAAPMLRIFRADAARRWRFSYARELLAGEALRLAGFSSGTGVCARGGTAGKFGIRNWGAGDERVRPSVSGATVCPRHAFGVAFLSRRFVLGSCPAFRFWLVLLSAHPRLSVSAAALPSAHVRPSVCRGICSRRAVGVAFLTHFALSARPAFRFWRSALPSVRARRCISAAAFALNSCTAFRFSRGSVLSSSCPYGSGVTFALVSSCPCDSTAALPSARARPSASSAALPSVHAQPSVSAAAICLRFAPGVEVLAQLFALARGWCCVSCSLCPQFMPGIAVLSQRFTLSSRQPSVSGAALPSVHAQPLRFCRGALPSARVRPSVSGATVYPRHAFGVAFLSRLCSRFTPGHCVSAAALCPRRTPGHCVSAAALCPRRTPGHCISAAALPSARIRPSDSGAAFCPQLILSVRFCRGSTLSAHPAFRFWRGFALDARPAFRFCSGDLPSVHAQLLRF